MCSTLLLLFHKDTPNYVEDMGGLNGPMQVLKMAKIAGLDINACNS